MYLKSSLIPVLDYSLCVIKSDTLIPKGLCDRLIAAVKPLEDVPDEEKDWHPGSDGKVLDLVHPSLWPLVYGRSRALTNKRISVKDCLSHCGHGDVIPEPAPREAGPPWSRWGGSDVKVLSTKFQWLPCDVSLDSRGNPTIDSYINNLHPVEQAEMYPIIQEFIKASLPAWDLIYRWPEEFIFQRLTTLEVGPLCLAPEVCEDHEEYPGSCNPWNRPINEDEEPREENEPWTEDYDTSARGLLDHAWFDETHPPDLPDAYIPPSHHSHPDDDEEDRVFPVSFDDINTSGFFHKAPRVQVIAKLANIHLTPEKPTYDGGSWHIEGQLNEHICATALFYYSSHNITASRLAFRTPADQEKLQSGLQYQQDDRRSITRTFAIPSGVYNGSTLQDLGSVLTKEGRAVFFPNLVQHRVEPFELADKSQPGHRKILALFLVDPAVPIVSTANVPPQQGHWAPCKDLVRSNRRLPPEVTDMVLKNIDYFIEEDEAKKLREQLMAERTVMQEASDKALNDVQFSFCEH